MKDIYIYCAMSSQPPPPPPPDYISRISNSAIQVKAASQPTSQPSNGSGSDKSHSSVQNQGTWGARLQYVTDIVVWIRGFYGWAMAVLCACGGT